MFGRKHKIELYRAFKRWGFRCSCGAYASGGSEGEAQHKAAHHLRMYTKVR